MSRPQPEWETYRQIARRRIPAVREAWQERLDAIAAGTPLPRPTDDDDEEEEF